MKFSKIILSVAVAGAILGGAVTTASANPTTGSQTTYPQQTVSTAQPTHQVTYGNQNNQTVSTPQTTNQTTQSTGTTTSSSSNQATAVVSLAKKLATQNIPYVWGGESLAAWTVPA